MNALKTLCSALLLIVLIFALFAVAGMGWQVGKMIVGM